MMHLDQLPNQREGEKVVLFLRRHWITFATQLLAFVLLLAAPIALAIAFWPTVSKVLEQPIYGPMIAVGISIYILAIWLFGFIEYTDYYLDTWLVTNERIINIEQEGLFHRTFSELDLAAVQDVTSDVRGIAKTLINYGNVFIQTAGIKERFVFKTVPRPAKVTQIVAELVEADKRQHGMKEFHSHTEQPLKQKEKKK